MNILILFTQPWRTGGAETHVEALIKGFWQHNLYLAVNQGSDEQRLSKLKKLFPNLQIVMIQSRGINFLKWKQSIDELKHLIEAERIDIVAAQQRTAGIWAWRLSKLTGVNYTVTMHDPWHRAKFKKLYPKIFPKMIVVSDNLAKILVDVYGFNSQQISLANNGVDFSQFKPLNKLVARRELLLPDKKKVILHVSRMSNTKGAVSMVIIDALECLAKVGIIYDLVIIGEGPLRAKIEKRAQVFNQKYGEHIIVKNFVTDINTWYNAADILVGEGRVAIEALACEKPVIAIRNSHYFIGMITDKNIAYACEVNFDGKDNKATKEKMAGEIVNAFKLPEESSVTIAKYVKENLNIEKMVRVYLNVFNILINKVN